MVANGRTIKAIAVALHTTPSAVDDRVERLFVHLAEGVSSGQAGALDRLRRLHRAIVEREEQGESLSRLLPTGVADQLIADGRGVGETETLEVTVVMSDIRGYTSIAEHADPAVLAQQLNRHRAEMNRAILSEGGTVMQYVGDAVMAVFGAPVATPRPSRPGARRGARDAPAPGRRQRRMVGGGPHAVRPRHRAQHRRRSPRPCSAARSGSSTRSSATP